jgi:hypothetical protein
MCEFGSAFDTAIGREMHRANVLESINCLTMNPQQRYKHDQTRHAREVGTNYKDDEFDLPRCIERCLIKV